MTPHEADSSSTPSPRELQELWDLPGQIEQCDLQEIVNCEESVRLALAEFRARRDELGALRAQLETQIALGMRVEPGPLSILRAPDGGVKIIRAEGSSEEAPF
jgi:hypothetical protein